MAKALQQKMNSNYKIQKKNFKQGWQHPKVVKLEEIRPLF